MINYHNKEFVPIANSINGEVDGATVFKYQQTGNVLTCTYAGNKIVIGHLIALVQEDGSLDMRYHQLNVKGELMTGTCVSTPEILQNNKIRLHEKWKWTSGDFSEGTSILEET
jgi:hypothetical protein